MTLRFATIWQHWIRQALSWQHGCGGSSPLKKSCGHRLLPTFLQCVTLLICASAHAAPPTEYDVKVAFIHNIAKFVEWPDAMHSGGKLQLCILGQTPLLQSADLLVGKPVGSQTWEVRPVAAGASLQQCGILFIAATQTGNLRRVLETVRGKAILTVGDSEGYAERGVMVNFYPEQDKLRFEINVEALRRAGIKCSSQLLKLARIVPDGGVNQ